MRLFRTSLQADPCPERAGVPMPRKTALSLHPRLLKTSLMPHPQDTDSPAKRPRSSPLLGYPGRSISKWR
eukprot:6050315-Amphidinium_carterae.1